MKNRIMKNRPLILIGTVCFAGMIALGLVLTALTRTVLANCEPSVTITGPASAPNNCPVTLTANGSCPDGPCTYGDGDDCLFDWDIISGCGQLGNTFTSGQTSWVEVTPGVGIGCIGPPRVEVTFDGSASYAHTITASPWPGQGRLQVGPEWPVGCRGSIVNVQGTLPNANRIKNSWGCTKDFVWSISKGPGDAIVTLPTEAGSVTLIPNDEELFQYSVSIDPNSPPDSSIDLNLFVKVGGVLCSDCTDTTTFFVLPADPFCTLDSATGSPGDSLMITRSIQNQGFCAEAFDWTVTKTGGAPTITVTPSAGQTPTLSPNPPNNWDDLLLTVDIDSGSALGDATLQLDVRARGETEILCSYVATITVE